MNTDTTSFTLQTGWKDYNNETYDTHLGMLIALRAIRPTDDDGLDMKFAKLYTNLAILADRIPDEKHLAAGYRISAFRHATKAQASLNDLFAILENRLPSTKCGEMPSVNQMTCAFDDCGVCIFKHHNHDYSRRQ